MQNKNNNLDFLSKCSFCGGGFSVENLVLLEEQEQKTILHVTCSKCNTSAIFFLSNNQAGILSLGIMTDLDKDEVIQKFARGAVSADEVINAHQFISSKGENLIELFKNNIKS
ncbi:MAG: hypothetical protein WCX17_03155 [Parcubacteria group bacterium]|jgi:hypothetical protein